VNKLVINQLPVENLRGKRVFVRIDAEDESPSAPGALIDDYKLRAALPTFKYLVTRGARVVVGTHLGDPGGQTLESLRVDAIADRLSQSMSKVVRKLDEAVGREVRTAVADTADGEMILLENLRFYPGEERNDAQFARELAELCDVYCNDAFSIAHRGLASTVGITRHVRPSAAGLALARELTMFELALEKPDPPFLALVAGARVEEKLPVLENLLTRIDRLFIAGALAFTFLKAQGKEVGAARVDETFLPLAEDILDKAKKVEIILPLDFFVVDAGLFKLYEMSGGRLPVPEARGVLGYELTPSDLAVDIGPRTIKRVESLIEAAHTVFWNGPLGIWEVEPFSAGTREVARALIKAASAHAQRSMVCGDSLVRAMRSFDLRLDQLPHVTSGGHSALHLLAGKPLPGIASLNAEAELIAPLEKRPHKILLAVDGSKPSQEAATKLAGLVEADGAEINLLYVQKPPDFGSEKKWLDENRWRRELEYRLEGERVVLAANVPLLRHGLLPRRQLVVQGADPARVILQYADELGVELIAMGAHSRAGLLNFFVGSVSRTVLDQAKCPVLTARVPAPAEAEERF
jgi:phosphoglycerate kinase